MNQEGSWTDSEIPGMEKFNAVKGVLETNRLLINEINRNHELRTPEALGRNVVLIRQLNTNVGKVVDLYKEISLLFVISSREGEG